MDKQDSENINSRIDDIQIMQSKQLEQYHQLALLTTQIAEGLKHAQCDLQSQSASNTKLIKLEIDMQRLIEVIDGRTKTNSRLIIGLINAGIGSIIGLTVHYVEGVKLKEPLKYETQTITRNGNSKIRNRSDIVRFYPLNL